MKKLFNFDGSSVKKELRQSGVYLSSFGKWLLCAGVTGLLCGLVGTLFHICLQAATACQSQYSWLLYFLPFAGLLIVLLYHVCNMRQDPGTNLVFASIRGGEQVPLRMAFLIFCGTLLTHLFGGSSGREGAALQIGGSIGGFIGRTLHLDEQDMRIFTMCGMSAAFSALFGTPLTAAIFSMEVVSVGMVYYVALLPALISALIAFGIAGLCGIAPTHFSIPALPAETWDVFLQVILLGVLCAFVSILLCVCIRTAGKLFRRFFHNPYLRIAVGGALVVGLSLLCGTRDYNGAGMDVITRAVGGSAMPAAFLLKLLFTALTLGCGFKGGEIVPTFFIGATFGCVTGGLLGLPAGFGAAVGLVATFCGVVNCPFASIILSVELFGSDGILLFAAACAVSYMLSGRYSLYTSQKIIYSKIKASYIDADTR